MAAHSAKNFDPLGVAARAARAQNALTNRDADNRDEVFGEGRLLSVSLLPVLFVLGFVAYAA